ncbi:uncharacterized protein JCM15063_002352 [Sporobolomyces koalae]|uniref:uncharacterized protein n=1 Tax=Sporobolomyces koalae TaxID=500713 RepID=UPI003170081A
MDAELTQVVQALVTLYSPSTPPSVQSQLQSQLLAVQSAPLGWALISPFLSHADASIRFFGASTLEAKLSKQWDSLPRADRHALRASLLGWVAESARRAYPPTEAEAWTGEKPVLRKLSAAIVTYALKAFGTGSTKGGRSHGAAEEAEEVDEPWQDWLLEVVMRIAASGSRREAALEVLSDAIEQVHRAELTGTRRMAFMSSLSSSTPHLVQTLETSLASTNTTTSTEAVLALSCFNSYLSAGQLSHVELTTLYPLLISHLSNSNTIVAACSAVEELVERSNGLSGSGSGVTKFMNRNRCSELIENWVTSPYVADLVRTAVNDAGEGADDVDDDAIAVFKLICTLAEYFISTYLFEPPPAAANSAPLTLLSPSVHTMLSFLITLSTFPGHSPDSSYTINEFPTGAWLALQEYGADEGFTLNGSVEAEKEGQWQVYKGVWTALKDGLRSRAVKPPLSQFSTWPKDIKDAFRIYRNTVLIDPIQYCFYVLREEMLGSLVELANQQVDNVPQEGQIDAYEELEATLFTINCLSECVPMSPPPTSLSASTSSTASTSTSLTTTYLSYLFSPSLLGRLPSTGSAHLALRNTSLKLLESYSVWFSSQPAACLLAIQFVVASLQEPQLIPQAVRSLRGLCNSNRKVLSGHVGDFVGILGGLEGHGVEETELAKVLESVASVVQALEPEQIVEPILVSHLGTGARLTTMADIVPSQTLTNPIISKLEVTLQGRNSPDEDLKQTCITQLVYLTSLTKGLSTPEPEVLDLDVSFDDTIIRENATRVMDDARIKDLRTRLGTAIEGTAKYWASDLEVVSALSDLIRNSVADTIPSALSLDPLLLLALCASSMRQSPSSIWLGIGGSLLARLARDKSGRSLEQEELQRIGTPVEAMLSLVLSTHQVQSAMSENPDVVSSFLSLCSQVVRNYAEIFTNLPPDYLDAVLAFTERGLGLQEQFTLKATIELLLLALQQTKMADPSSQHFAAAFRIRTHSIVRSTLLAIAGAVPRSHLVSLSELLHACLLRLPEQARPALKELLATPGWPNERTTEEAKGKFERSVLSARTGRQVRQAVNDFALLARGLDGSAYGTKILSRFHSPLGQRGYIAKVPSLKTVVIQFTGTSNPQNVFSDTQFVPISLNSEACGSGCRGFAGAVLNYRDAKRATNGFAAAFDALETGYTLTITGHSLGGAVAAIAGVDLPADFLITFGEFRVGNPATARYIDQKYGSNTYRVVHALDSVPAVVPRSLTSQHHGRAFLLAGTTLASLSECSSAESLKCGGGLNTLDHLLYFVPTASCGLTDPTRGITI